MIFAYDEALLERACRSLGMMLDYAAYSLHTSPDTMMDLFSASDAAARFERGDIRLICGMSGIELAYHVLERSGLSYERIAPRHTISLSAEYWAGHALAYIQHQSCRSFDDIRREFSIPDFIADYTKQRTRFLADLPLDISEEERQEAARQFGRNYAKERGDMFSAAYYKKADDGAARGTDPLAKKKKKASGTEPLAKIKKTTTGSVPLAEMRIKNGLSQSQLAKASGIPLRTIQQYEQRQKDLSKARAESLLALARALHCDPSALL